MHPILTGAARTALLLLPLCAAAIAAPPAPDKTDVYIGGENGYHTYRIPALAISSQGTALAFCEARKDSPSDQGNIDLVLKRSTDGGATWGSMQLVHEEGGDAPITIGNPSPVVVHDSDTIHLLFTRNNKRLFYTRSDDDGMTWQKPEERTNILKDVDFPWHRIASGPVHGIQMNNGRLVVPMWFCDAEPHAKEKRYRSGVIYSDDQGGKWQAGDLVAETIPRLNECTVVERRDGSLLLTMRAYKAGFRATATSADGGETWSAPELEKQLPDPTCQGSILRLRDGRMLFSNIPADSRIDLSLRVSTDEGETWSAPRQLEEGPSAYSDLGQFSDGAVLCLYERGDERYSERITAARIDPAWLAPVEDAAP